MAQYTQHGWKCRLVRACLVAGLVAAVPLLPGLGVSEAVAQAQKEADTRPVRRTPALRQKVFEGMSAAQVAMEAKQYNEAIAVLQAMLNDTSRTGKLNSYEAAMVWRNIGSVYATAENYPKAIEAFQQVVAQENIPYGLEAEMRYVLAQLYMASENYRAAITALNDWFKVADNPGPDAYILLGQAYLLSEQYDPALKAVNQAMAIAAERGVEPREQWYLLLRVMHYQKNDYKKTAEVLEELVRRWPKAEYWTQLAMMYGQINKPDQQLHTLETAYIQNMLTKEGELMMLAQLLASKDVPYKAAKIIDKGIKDGLIKPEPKVLEFLGESWRRSQEVKRALPELEKAAKGADNGETYLRLAHVYMSLDQFDKAVAAARNAISKGKLRRPEEAQLLLGQALFNNKDFQAAGQAFEKARGNEKTAQAASQWLEYMDREVDRQKQIEQYLSNRQRS